jgi:hypothetical protein
MIRLVESCDEPKIDFFGGQVMENYSLDVSQGTLIGYPSKEIQSHESVSCSNVMLRRIGLGQILVANHLLEDVLNIIKQLHLGEQNLMLM